MEIETKIVGINFRGKEARNRVNSAQADEEVLLKQEPENPYDAGAIAVYLPNQLDPTLPPLHVGYIPKTDNPIINSLWGQLDRAFIRFTGADNLMVVLYDEPVDESGCEAEAEDAGEADQDFLSSDQ